MTKNDSSYGKTFKRIEKKYILNSDEYDLLMKEIKKYFIEDKYYQNNICNIYFDNNSDLIINSIEKPLFKQKIRLRSYGIPILSSNVFLEVKTKYKKIVNKRRVQLTLQEFYDFIKYNKYNHNDQIMKEIAYLFHYYHLKPAIFISYFRESYLARENSYLRITFDSHLISRRDNLQLEKGIFGNNFFNDNYYIMEIKTLGSMPLWLAKFLSDNKIFPVSFSKYGKIYQKEFVS